MGDEVTVDDALVEECQREQQSDHGYSDTRDKVVSDIKALMAAEPALTRERIVWHVAQLGSPQ